MSHADVADQPLKPLAPGRRRAGLALIVVDDDDLLVMPAEGDSAPAKLQVRTALKVIRPDLEVGIHDDLRSWMLVAIVART
jgi:hypothetical protein